MKNSSLFSTLRRERLRFWTHIFPFTQRLGIASHWIEAVSLRIYTKPTEGTDFSTIPPIDCILPAPSTGGMGQCALYRGVPPEKPCYMSGLGLYGVTKAAEHSQSAAEMFEMQKQPLSDYLQEVLASNDWNEVEWPDDTEFLRLKPPFSRGYWQEKPDKVETPSMARYGAPNKLYAFYRCLNGHFEQKAIPTWRVDDFRTIGQPGYGEYRRIACGLLEAAQQLPPVAVKFSPNHIVSIKLGYRLPPAEEDFFKLYSWPINYDITQKTPQVFQREMSKIVYPVFKQHLESIGYRFVEE